MYPGNLTKIKLAAALLATILIGGCIAKRKETKSHSALSFKRYEENPFTQNAAFKKTLLNALESTTTKSLTVDALWSLSRCQCAYEFAGQYLNDQSRSVGVLPQALVPAIREEVLSDKFLKPLLSAQNGAFGPIADFLIKTLAKDDKIAGRIRDDYHKKLTNSIHGGTQLKNMMSFSADLFAPISALTLPASTSSFRVSEQASRWALIFATPHMWDHNAYPRPIGFSDYGLQLFETAKALSSWSYVFGLDSTQSGKVYGGLTLDPIAGAAGGLKTFKGAKESQPRIFSGTYTIGYPKDTSVNLASKIQESWDHSREPVTLDEQARLWAAAALAYGRLKPSARTRDTNKMLASNGGLFPDNVHELTLSFLPGLGALLDGPLIDAKAQLVFAQTSLPIGGTSQKLADMRTLSRLAFALSIWVDQSANITLDKLTPALTKSIQAALVKLKDALRLSIQAIISQHVDYVGSGSDYRIILVTDAASKTRPPLTEVAEVLATMAAIEQTTLTSESGTPTDWQLKIIGLYHWFVADYLAPLASGSGDVLDASAVFWTYRAIGNLSNYDQSLSQAPWLADLKSSLENASASGRQYQNDA
jgi:hypothetical protein